MNFIRFLRVLEKGSFLFLAIVKKTMKKSPVHQKKNLQIVLSASVCSPPHYNSITKNLNLKFLLERFWTRNQSIRRTIKLVSLGTYFRYH